MIASYKLLKIFNRNLVDVKVQSYHALKVRGGGGEHDRCMLFSVHETEVHYEALLLSVLFKKVVSLALLKPLP